LVPLKRLQRQSIEVTMEMKPWSTMPNLRNQNSKSVAPKVIDVKNVQEEKG
jgi:hypothetical protein